MAGVIEARAEDRAGAVPDHREPPCKAEGDRFSISYDGKMLFTAKDNTFAGPGKVALWTKADSVTHFDTIAITPLD